MTIDLTGGIDPGRELILAARPEEDGIRDAVNVWIEADDGAFGMRIGIEALAEEWDAHDVWLDVAFADGRVLSLRDRFQPHSAIDEQGQATVRGAGPVRFQCIEPFRLWTINFKGQAAVTSATDLIQEIWPDDPSMAAVEFDIEMSMAVPPWASGTLLKEAGASLKGEQGQFMSPRYEQLFRARGSLQINDEIHNFTACGLRIRRQGFRKFEGFWGHCWQSAVFPSGRAFGFNVYPPAPDGSTSFNEGFIFTGEGALIPARVVEAPWLVRLNASGDDVPVVLETDQERITIAGTSFINLRSRAHVQLPPDFPIIQQSHVRFQWDNEVSVGMMERSSMPSKMEL